MTDNDRYDIHFTFLGKHEIRESRTRNQVEIMGRVLNNMVARGEIDEIAVFEAPGAGSSGQDVTDTFDFAKIEA